MIFERDPTTPWRDFAHRMVVGFVVVGIVTLAQILFYASAPLLGRMYESKAYRDAMSLSALHDAAVTSVQVDGGAAVIEGTFVKRRCDFVRGNYYTRSSRGILVPAARFESLVPDAERNRVRPPSSEPQTFGPWRITSLITDPAALVIYVTMRCPEGTFTQLLADTPWENFPARKP